MEKRTHERQLLRIAVAVVIAPLAAPATTLIMMTGGDWSDDNAGLLWLFGFGLFFGYCGLVLGGIPIIVVLRRLKRLNVVTLTIAGAIAGVIVFQVSLFVLGLLLDSTGGYGLLSVIYGAFAGAAVACCFGLIAGVENLKGDMSRV